MTRPYLRMKMRVKVLPLLVSFSLCLGCTSEEWVKEYVKGEMVGLQEGVQKGQVMMEGQIKEMGASIEALEKKLVEWDGAFKRLQEGYPTTEGEALTEEEISNLRREMERKFADLGKMAEDLRYIKEYHLKGYFDRDRDIVALGNRVEDTKEYLDKQVTLALKGHERLKDFIIEEVRLLRLERQEYAKELEAIKNRLQAIEGAIGQKEPPET
jgi:hypothetical protein